MNKSRPTLLRWLLASCALLLLAGCATGPTIRSDFDPAIDFSHYRTWGYYEPLSAEKSGYATINSQRVKDAVRREMTQRGYTYTPASPELRVNFYTSIQDRVRVSPGFYDPYFYGGPWGWGGWGGWGWGGGWYGAPFYDRPYVSSYREGKLVVDVVDAAQNRLVWTGSASEPLRSKQTPQERAAGVDNAVTQIFTQYPYAAGTASGLPPQ